jgi:hypothetical protein
MAFIAFLCDSCGSKILIDSPVIKASPLPVTPYCGPCGRPMRGLWPGVASVDRPAGVKAAEGPSSHVCVKMDEEHFPLASEATLFEYFAAASLSGQRAGEGGTAEHAETVVSSAIEDAEIMMVAITGRARLRCGMIGLPGDLVAAVRRLQRAYCVLEQCCPGGAQNRNSYVAVEEVLKKYGL